MKTDAVRVMQVITRGEAGGAQTHLLALCERMAREVDLHVVIGSPSGRSVLGDRLRASGIETLHLADLRNSLNPLQFLRAVRSLVALLRRHQPDLVHAHSSFAGAVARLAGRWCRIPVVYTVHGFGFKPEARPLLRYFAWLGEALLAPLTTHMICVSDHEAKLAARLPLAPAAVSVIRNGLPDVPWRAEPGREPARVVMVARLAAPKRADLLLQALSMLPLPPATRILGDGPERASLQARARSLGLRAVEFAGSVDNVAEHLAQHAIFVLLSDHEGLPISIIEAMRAGLAIVASRLPGVEELVTHEESALLVGRDPQEIRDALARLLADAALRQGLAAAARSRYERAFTEAAMSTDVLALYRTLVRTRPARH